MCGVMQRHCTHWCGGWCIVRLEIILVPLFLQNSFRLLALPSVRSLIFQIDDVVLSQTNFNGKSFTTFAKSVVHSLRVCLSGTSSLQT